MNKDAILLELLHEARHPVLPQLWRGHQAEHVGDALPAHHANIISQVPPMFPEPANR